MSFADKRPRRPVSERDGDDTLLPSDRAPAPDRSEQTTEVELPADQPDQFQGCATLAAIVLGSFGAFALVLYVGCHVFAWCAR